MLMEEIGDLKSPIEAVERTAHIEVLEALLAEKSILKDSQCSSTVPSLLVGFVDFESLLELNAILNRWASRST